MDPQLRERISRLEVLLSNQEDLPRGGSQEFNETAEKAKAIIKELETVPTARRSLGVPRWVNLIGLLQRLAFVDPDTGSEPDITNWCERQWAEVLRDHPHNVPALQGQSERQLSRT